MPFVDVAGVPIFYRFDGAEGLPVLVLSNSLGTDLGMWEPQLAAFAGRFRVLRYDSRGHGQSGAPPGPYTIDLLGRDVLALLDVLQLERVTFCGLSKGGMVGQWLGVHAGERLARLILANTSSFIGAPEIWNSASPRCAHRGMQPIVRRCSIAGSPSGSRRRRRRRGPHRRHAAGDRPLRATSPAVPRCATWTSATRSEQSAHRRWCSRAGTIWRPRRSTPRRSPSACRMPSSSSSTPPISPMSRPRRRSPRRPSSFLSR